MSRPKREIAPEESERLAAIRSRAQEAQRLLVDGSAARTIEALLAGEAVDGAAEILQTLKAPPDSDQLGTVAWIGELDGEAHERGVEAIARAQHARYQWREIADALGFDPDDRVQVQGVGQRFRERRNS